MLIMDSEKSKLPDRDTMSTYNNGRHPTHMNTMESHGSGEVTDRVVSELYIVAELITRD